MTTRLTTVCFDAVDPAALAQFWAETLSWDLTDQGPDEIALIPTDGTQFVFLFLRVPLPKAGKNRIHFDLVAESAAHQLELVDHLTSIGARAVDVGQPDDADHHVLADPEGNEFCVVIRGEFLATTGLLGAIVFEPANHDVGYFWSEVIGWPIVYDQDGDTAIRAPDGTGPFITFGPPVTEPNSNKNRVHLDVAPAPDDDHASEVARFIALGASRIDIGQRDVTWKVLADPDGNEFCVLRPH